MRYQDVFRPGGDSLGIPIIPGSTFSWRIGRLSQERQHRTRYCHRADKVWKKTVLARRVLPPEDSIWIDGGTIGSEKTTFGRSSLSGWGSFKGLKKPVPGRRRVRSVAVQRPKQISLSPRALVRSALRLLLPVETKTTGSRTLSSRVVALKGLREANTPLIVDDHFLPTARKLRGAIVRALKPVKCSMESPSSSSRSLTSAVRFNQG